jgi:hypothetical protein
MPPQQAYGLLDFVDNILDFYAHSSVLSDYHLCGVHIDSGRSKVNPSSWAPTLKPHVADAAPIARQIAERIQPVKMIDW